jgi:hypothetical protein
MDLLAAGSKWIAEQLATHAAGCVTITDRIENPTVTITLPATAGATQWEETTADGAIHQIDSTDWLIATADLRDRFGDPSRLRRGWIVRPPDGIAYEIFAPPGGQPWQYSDPSRHAIRIHSKALTTR